jgi:hypothetical protein
MSAMAVRVFPTLAITCPQRLRREDFDIMVAAQVNGLVRLSRSSLEIVCCHSCESDIRKNSASSGKMLNDKCEALLHSSINYTSLYNPKRMDSLNSANWIIKPAL